MAEGRDDMYRPPLFWGRTPSNVIPVIVTVEHVGEEEEEER